MSINYGPDVSWPAKLKTPCAACDNDSAEWNGHDGCWDCQRCGMEQDVDNIDESNS